MNGVSLFISQDIIPLEELRNSYPYKMREILNNGGKMTREQKDSLTKNVNECFCFKNAIAIRGYRFDFSDVLKRFVVNQFDGWREYCAVDKTSLRKILYGRINKIVEVK